MTVYPAPLTPGSTVRVVTPSLSLPFVVDGTTGDYLAQLATRRLNKLGLTVTFGEHVNESDEFFTSEVQSRVRDIHAAFADPEVDGIMSVIGGFNSNELLPFLDYDLIAANPKFLCGHSDVTALQNALYARTGLVTYSGPHWSTFGMRDHSELTRQSFANAAFTTEPIVWEASPWYTDDDWYVEQDNRPTLETTGWWPIREGRATGTAVGSNLSIFTLLHGTDYIPDLDGAVLFAEVTMNSDITEFRRRLMSVIQQPGGEGIRAVVIGRFQTGSGVTREELESTIDSIPLLEGIPVVANVDFGHTNPLLTFPVGGDVELNVAQNETTICFPRELYDR
ncbi:Microcin C7 self-immunity protein MccF [Corynebacterium capitovis DSM 44611]|uniref:S66 family peptidase n=1 Tax=Corynebacterium capitovis TaxID=131081 RepID=UPI0003660BE9|nr:S66 peptidase family protein [Corynebacterium capitovis]WKD56628.1 Microcin C7 self-immunity protein MccF [Corynebacterium capitovis DSM 44611]